MTFHTSSHGVFLFVSAGDILFADSILPSASPKCLDFYHNAISNIDSVLMSETRDGTITDQELLPLIPQLKLRKGRCLMQAPAPHDRNTVSEIQHLFQGVLEDSLSTDADRAWAHVHLAQIELSMARKAGSLHALWKAEHPPGDFAQGDDRNCGQRHDTCIADARNHLLFAASFLPCGSAILFRTILRTLALVTGPNREGEVSWLSSGVLVLASVGRAALLHMLRSMGVNGRNDDVDIFESIFSAWNQQFTTAPEHDERMQDFFRRFSDLCPHNWKFVCPVICPTGELLICSVEKPTVDGTFQLTTTCCFPPGDADSVYDEILVPLDQIMHESQDQVQGMDYSLVEEQFNKESAKRRWWNGRNQLDAQLQDHIHAVEVSYFSALHHLRTSGYDEGENSEDAFPIDNLASRFEAACDINDEEPSEDDLAESLRLLTVPKLKERLAEFGYTNSQMRKLRKQQVIDLLIEEETKNKQHESSSEGEGEDNDTEEPSSATTDGCLFLILDENLQRFPFEGMSCLENKAVCRVPGLAFVLATLYEHERSSSDQLPTIDPSKTAFVLDPENNLSGTRNRLEPVLDKVSRDQNWEWDGIIGEKPSMQFFKENLERDRGLVLYFGHGGAQCCFPRRQVEEMIHKKEPTCDDGDNRPSMQRSCTATVVLMGCSSGRLVSVNQKKHQQRQQQIPLYYEPEGIALSYLCAGSPCVVGNLWDVTDHDIDR